MTLEEAEAVLSKMDMESLEPFTGKERDAISTIGLAFLTNKITHEQMTELMKGADYKKRM